MIGRSGQVHETKGVASQAASVVTNQRSVVALMASASEL